MIVGSEKGVEGQDQEGQAPASYRQTPPIEPQMYPPKRKPDTLLIAVLAIVIALAIIVPLLFVPWQSVSTTRTGVVEADGSIEGIRMDAKCDVGRIDVKFHEGGELCIVEVRSTGVKSLLAPDFNLTLQIQHTAVVSEGLTWMEIDVQVDTNENLGRYWVDTECVISLDKGMIMDIEAKSTLGGVNMTAPSSVEFRNIDLVTSTGFTALKLSPETIVNGTISLATTTGFCTFEMNDAILNQDAEINILTTTGGISAIFSQEQLMGGNLTVDLNTNTGFIELNVTIAGEVSAIIESDIGTGGIDATTTGFSGPDDDLISDGHPGTNHMAFVLDTNTGGISIKATYTV